ncbi:ankyrin repeat-containing protein BDA1-like [Carica papaya]|uniref:ankyrin repeat-containing protein BDA1-like n=1 Tax=Carica papaya TaxID=3649 RepID=UPI000B8CFF6D|nr:ankyrin repeat-containing protein BDA1-like [Carica papaya]
MDLRLFDAAQTGNISYFHQLLAENPLILHNTSLFSTYNPLHIASSTGHVDFVKEILRLKPEFSDEVNQDGFSPMHIAAANGHVEIVKELMKVDKKLCRVEGRDKKTPLHHAAIKGKVDVISEIVLCDADCLEDLSVQRENALHLAVMNNQFQATRVLLDLARELKKEHVLNMRDEYGNTVLHLATWKKQRQIIELLIGKGTTNSQVLEVNAINKTHLTALDLLMIFPSEAGDREIEEILRGAGALRAKDIAVSANPSIESSDSAANTPAAPRRSQSRLKDTLEYFKFKKGRDSPSEARSTLLVIAILVATATFQAGLSPPGGVWQDHNLPGRNSSTSIDKEHFAGWSIMGTASGITFVLFVLFNSIGFSVSLFMINILTRDFPLQFELQICMVAMYFTYSTAMSVIAPESLKLFIIIFTSIYPTFTPVLTSFLKLLIKKLADEVKVVWKVIPLNFRWRESRVVNWTL